MPLIILSLAPSFMERVGITSSRESNRYLEGLVSKLPRVVAPILSSAEHPVSDTDIEIWPHTLHPLARTKFGVSIDIFTARDDEREADCQERTDEIEKALQSGFFPADTRYCVDIHLDIEGFAAGIAW